MARDDLIPTFDPAMGPVVVMVDGVPHLVLTDGAGRLTRQRLTPARAANLARTAFLACQEMLVGSAAAAP